MRSSETEGTSKKRRQSKISDTLNERTHQTEFPGGREGVLRVWRTSSVGSSHDLVGGNTGTLRVLTYNIFMRPPLIKTGWSDYKDERLRLFAEAYLDNYDVIGLQELFATGTKRPERLKAMAHEKGFQYSLTEADVTSHKPCSGTPRSRDGILGRLCYCLMGAIDSGLMLLSRHEIVERDFHMYSVGHGVDSFARKGVLYAKLKLSEARSISVFVTHLQASYVAKPKSTSHDVLVREQQLSELRDFILEKCAGSLSTEMSLLIGDFNVDGRLYPETEETKPTPSHGSIQLHPSSTGNGSDDLGSHEIESEYEKMLRMFNRSSESLHACDLVRVGNEDAKYKYTTFPGTGLGQGDPVKLTLDHLRACSRLDYIFTLGSLENCHKRLILQNLNIQSFRVDSSRDRQYPFNQLSDHYGIEAEFQLL